MKKPIAVTLLVFGDFAAVIAVSFLLLFAALTLGVGLAIVIGLAVLIPLGLASSQIGRIFGRKYGMKKSRFILTAFVPPVAGSVIYLIAICILDAAGAFSGFLAGLGEFLMALSLVPTSLVYLISGVVWVTARYDK